MQSANIRFAVRIAAQSNNQHDFLKFLPKISELNNDDDEYLKLFNELLENQNWHFLKLFLEYKKAKNILFRKAYGIALLRVLDEINASAPKIKEEVAIALIDAGANLGNKDEAQNTALHLAIKNNKHTIVKLLLFQGASLTNRNNNDKAPIMLASWEMVETITSCVCVKAEDVNQSQFDLKLHYAVRYKNIQAAKCLLIAGATPFTWCAYSAPEYLAYEDFALLPYHTAMINNDPEMIALLLMHTGEDGLSLEEPAKMKKRVSPLKFASQVNNDALKKGLNLFKGYNVKDKSLPLETLIKTQRHFGSNLHSHLPLNILDKIVSISHPLASSSNQLKTEMTITRTTAFIKEYQQGDLHIRSKKSGQLVFDLESILRITTISDELKAEHIQKTINDFIINSFKEKENEFILRKKAAGLVSKASGKVSSELVSTVNSIKTKLKKMSHKPNQPTDKDVELKSLSHLSDHTDPKEQEEVKVAQLPDNFSQSNQQKENPTKNYLTNRATALLFKYKLDNHLLVQNEPGEFTLRPNAKIG